MSCICLCTTLDELLLCWHLFCLKITAECMLHLIRIPFGIWGNLSELSTNNSCNHDSYPPVGKWYMVKKNSWIGYVTRETYFGFHFCGHIAKAHVLVAYGWTPYFRFCLNITALYDFKGKNHWKLPLLLCCKVSLGDNTRCLCTVTNPFVETAIDIGVSAVLEPCVATTDLSALFRRPLKKWISAHIVYFVFAGKKLRRTRYCGGQPWLLGRISSALAAPLPLIFMVPIRYCRGRRWDFTCPCRSIGTTRSRGGRPWPCCSSPA